MQHIILQAQRLSSSLGIQTIISPQRLLSISHGAPCIDGEQAGLLPLVAHDRTRAKVVVLTLLPSAASHRPVPVELLAEAARLGDGAGDLVAEPALLPPGLALRRRVEHGPHGAEPEAPGRVGGPVLVDDDLDVPGPAQQVHPLARRLGGRVRHGDAPQPRGLVAVRDGAEGQEGFLGD